MDTESLRRLALVVRYGSLNKAAGRLGLTQPALSRTLQLLEAHYGVPLLVRSRSGVAPTAYGETVLRRANLIEAELQRIESDVAALRSGSIGRVSIGVPSGVGIMSEALPLVIRGMLGETARQLELNLRLGNQAELLEGLRQGALDFLLADIADPKQILDLDYEFVFADRCVLAVRTSHPLATQSRIRIGDLLRHPWAVFAVANPMEGALRQFAASFGMEFKESVFRSNSALFMRSMVLQSDTIGLMSYDSIRADLAKGDVMELPLPTNMNTASLPVYRFGIIQRKDALQSPPAQMLMEALIRSYRRAG